jgi:hypothetical protein
MLRLAEKFAFERIRKDQKACAAWRKLIAQTQTITSIGMRDWAHVGQQP